MPWKRGGGDILPSMLFSEYSSKMHDFKTERDGLIAAFVVNFDHFVSEAQTALNGLFNPADYPDRYKLADMFDMKIETLPLPGVGDFRVELADDEIQAVRNQFQADEAQRQAGSMRKLWDRVFNVVQHMQSKLSDEKGKFHNSLVTNAQELCRLLPALNITGDPILEEMRIAIEDKLIIDPETLRSNKIVRRETSIAADAIMAKMAGFMAVANS